jgi:hypothetical protein
VARYSIGLIALTTLACGSNDKTNGTQSTSSGGSGNSSAATGGTSQGGAGDETSGTGGSTGGSGGGKMSSGGTGGKVSSGGSSGKMSSGGSGGQIMGLPTVPGEPCNSVDTKLPPKPCMVNVTVQVNGDAANVHFDPVDGAKDYRIYALPADSDIQANGDALTIQNALYRCAGAHEVPPANVDSGPQLPGGGITTLVDNENVGGYTRTLDDATLGYVSAVPADGLIPVYALGDSSKDGDNSCYYMRWKESRVKHYVTSDSDRKSMLAQGFRDDGIAFYAPAAGADGSRTVYTSTDNMGAAGARYYYIDGPEAAVRSGGTAAFSVLTDAADGLIPLKRVFYVNSCGTSHDELTPGETRFQQARTQGDAWPLTELQWSGLTGETTLVVEALADGCPNNLPGLLGPEDSPPFTNDFGHVAPSWVTLDDAKALLPSGEVYINGQFDAGNQPRPIARSFVKVKPAAAPDLDWFQGFDGDNPLGTITDEPCGNPINCGGEWRFSTDVGDIHFISVEEKRHTLNTELGQLWVMYDDGASDTPGKFRLTANQDAMLSADNYLYITMDVNAFTTSRRYPQIIVSDQHPPVQWNLTNGKTIVIQTFGEWPYLYELEVCDHRNWDVNDQCPAYDLYHYFESGTTDRVKSLAPNNEVGDRVGIDRNSRFEVWVSSQRAYLYLEGQPYGCVDLPSGAPGVGPVTVTFGDTLYHSGVDNLDYYSYMKANYQTDTRRQYDNLGFKSGVAAPTWDDTRFPCVPSTAIMN